MASGLRWLTRKTARTRGDHAEDRTLARSSLPPVMLQDVPLALLHATPGATAVTASKALNIADAYACVRALSDAAGSLPLVVYRRTTTGRERLDNHTVDLLRQPAPATTQSGLIGQLVAHLNLYGNAYVGKFRDSEGRIDQLALLHPDRVTPELKAGRPIYTVSGSKGERSVHGPDDVIHVRALTTDGLLGLSPVKQCRTALGLSADLTDHAARFFSNDARPGGLLKLGDRASGGDILKGISEAWGGSHRGNMNAHRVAVVTGNVEFEPVGMPMDDAQFLEQRKLSATETARIFRVPPYMIGAESGASMTYSNVEQESLHFVTYGLRPHLVAIEQALSADADLFARTQYAEFLLDALLRADSKTRAEVYALALNPETGWMTRQEVRRLENLQPETETL
jgi:HK97 family phage portal protein